MNTNHIGAFEAKTHLSEILERVRQGRSYVITKRGAAVAELRPVTPTARRLSFGCDKNKVRVHADFDAPIPGMEQYQR